MPECDNCENCEIKIKALEKLMYAELKARDTALQLQADKNETHFQNLNHENDRIRQIQNTCVSNDVYTIRHEVFEKRIKAVEEFMSNQQGRQVIIPVVISFVTALAIVAINYLLTGNR